MPNKNNALTANDDSLPDGFNVTSRDTRNQRILTLWNEGKASYVIANSMQISRNMVLGVVRRARQSGETVRDGETTNRTKVPDDLEKKILALWNDGNGRRVIAERLDCSFSNVCAVIQRGHRSGKARKKDKAATETRLQQVLVERKKAVTAVEPVQEKQPAKILPVPENAQPTAFLDLAFNQCRFPLWDDSSALPKLHCGAPRAENDRCYCAAHKAIAWKPARPHPEVLRYQAEKRRAVQAQVKAFMKFRRAVA